MFGCFLPKIKNAQKIYFEEGKKTTTKKQNKKNISFIVEKLISNIMYTIIIELILLFLLSLFFSPIF